MDGKDFENAISSHLDIKDKPITVFIDYIPRNVSQLQENAVNILIILEPNQLFGLHDWAIKNNHLFSCILTWSEPILKSCDNAYLFSFGISWLDKAYIDNVDSISKRYEVSFLCGAKKMIEGHHLRHRLYKRGDEIKIPKQWYYTLSDYTLVDGQHHTINMTNGIVGAEKRKLWDSMFSICVENSTNTGYHTEKIIDAFLSKTIPIYWGADNLAELGYDMTGVIQCKDENEIIEQVNKLTEESYYSRKDAMNHNYIKAKYYADIFSRFVTMMREIVTHNNI